MCVAIAVKTGGDLVIPSGFIGLAVNLVVVFASQRILKASSWATLADDDARVNDRVDSAVVGEFGVTRLTAECVVPKACFAPTRYWRCCL